MSVQTTYDDLRDEIRQDLKNCLKKARGLLDEDIWGYSEMKKGYALNVYRSISETIDSI